LPLLPCELSAIMDIIATLLNISPSVHTEESLTYDTNFFSRSSSRSSSNTVFARSKKRKHKGPRCRLEIIAASLKDDSIDHAAKSTGLDVAVVRQCRARRSSETSYSEEKEWLWSILKNGVEVNSNTQERFVRFKLCNGMAVQKRQFIEAYGFDRRRIDYLESRAIDPHIFTASPPKIIALPCGLRFSPTELTMAAFLTAFVDLYSDEQPNNKTKHLDPVVLTELWLSYTVSCKYRGKLDVLGSKSLLGKVWANRFIYAKKVCLRRNKGVRGGQCFICTLIKFMGDRAETHAQKLAYAEASKEHRAFHGTERELQTGRMHAAELDQDSNDVILMDIWDISKNLVPWSKYGSVDGAFGDTDKNVIRNRIQGIMFHGKRPQLFLYKSLPTVDKGANLSCTQVSPVP
jgi:hypothetical protein